MGVVKSKNMEKSIRVVDSFGKSLHIGDTICWIGSPSLVKELREGILLDRPELAVRALNNSKSDWFGVPDRNTILVECRRTRHLSRIEYRFPRIVKYREL